MRDLSAGGYLWSPRGKKGPAGSCVPLSCLTEESRAEFAQNFAIGRPREFWKRPEPLTKNGGDITGGSALSHFWEAAF